MSPPVQVVCAVKAPVVHRSLAAAPNRGSCGGAGRRSTRGEAAKTLDVVDKALRSAQAVLQPEPCERQGLVLTQSLNMQNISAMRRPGSGIVKPPTSPRTAAPREQAFVEDLENQEPSLSYVCQPSTNAPSSLRLDQKPSLSFVDQSSANAPSSLRLETAGASWVSPLGQCRRVAGARAPLTETTIITPCMPLSPRSAASASGVAARPVAVRPLSPRGEGRFRPLSPRGESVWESASASSRPPTPRGGEMSRPITPSGGETSRAPTPRGGETSRATSRGSSRPVTPRAPASGDATPRGLGDGAEAVAPARGRPPTPRGVHGNAEAASIVRPPASRGGESSRAASPESSLPCTPRGDTSGRAAPVARGRPPTPRAGEGCTESSSARSRLPTPRGGEGGGEGAPSARGPSPRNGTRRSRCKAERRRCSLAEARKAVKEQVCAEDRTRRFELSILERLDEVVQSLTPRQALDGIGEEHRRG